MASEPECSQEPKNNFYVLTLSSFKYSLRAIEERKSDNTDETDVLRRVFENSLFYNPQDPLKLEISRYTYFNPSNASK